MEDMSGRVNGDSGLTPWRQSDKWKFWINFHACSPTNSHLSKFDSCTVFVVCTIVFVTPLSSLQASHCGLFFSLIPQTWSGSGRTLSWSGGCRSGWTSTWWWRNPCPCCPREKFPGFFSFLFSTWSKSCLNLSLHFCLPVPSINKDF